MNYNFRPRDKYTGELIEGLTPTFTRFETSNGQVIIDKPEIIDQNGIYNFSYTSSDIIFVEIDLGEFVNTNCRYIDMTIIPTEIVEGDITLNHNFQEQDSLRFVNSEGIGINNATVSVYIKEDYDNGHRGDYYVIGRTTTKFDGRWKSDLKIDSNMEYVVEFYKQGEINPISINISTIE